MARRIPDDAGLLRRVHPSQIVKDQKTGNLRVSSGAFTDENLSVNVELFMTEDGLRAQKSLDGHQGYGLARVEAAVPRKAALEVVHDPIEGEHSNPYHAEVRGKKTRKIARDLAKASAIIVFAENS